MPVLDGQPVPGPVGDYNYNGIVDAADYVVWRNWLGTSYTQADYNVWRAHFGQTAGSGSGANANAAVPEQTTLILLTTAMLAIYPRRPRIVSQTQSLVEPAEISPFGHTFFGTRTRSEKRLGRAFETGRVKWP